MKNRFGDFAGNLLSDVIILGHARIRDLTRTYFPPIGERGPLSEIIPKAHCSLPSGKHCDKPDSVPTEIVRTVDDLHSTIGELLRARILCPVHESYTRPAADNIAEAEGSVSYDGSTKGKKQQEADWRSAVQKKLEEWKYGSKAEVKALARIPQGRKRTFEGYEDEVPAKKRKTAGLRTNGFPGTSGNQDLTSSGWLDVSWSCGKLVVALLIFHSTNLFYV